MKTTLLLAVALFVSSVLGAPPGSAPQNEEWQTLTEKAVELAKEGKFDDAISNCEKAIEMKGHYSSHHLLSQIYLAQAKHDKALTHMKKASELEPTSTLIKSGVKFHESVIAQSKGDYAVALSLLKESADMVTEQEKTQGHTDIQTLEKIVIAGASLGDIPFTVQNLAKIWALAPSYQFHNNIPFVRIADLYEEQQEAAREEGGEQAVDFLNKELANVTHVTDKIFFDIAMGPQPSKKVVIGLYGLAAPRAVKNLVTMAECSNKDLCYKGTSFHRVIQNFIVQGGDVAKGDGTGTANIYNRPYADEVYALALMHDRAGVVQMANSGKDSNGGQFVMMVNASPHLNGNHVVVGRILSGLDYVVEISKTGTNQDTHKPNIDVKVVNCGKA